MLEDGKEVPIPSLSSIMNIADVSGATQSGRVFYFVPPKRIEDTLVGKQAQVETTVLQSGQSGDVKEKSDHDDVLELIKRSEYNLVDKLLHTPSKISVIYLLMNLKAHK